MIGLCIQYIFYISGTEACVYFLIIIHGEVLRKPVQHKIIHVIPELYWGKVYCKYGNLQPE